MKTGATFHFDLQNPKHCELLFGKHAKAVQEIAENWKLKPATYVISKVDPETNTIYFAPPPNA